MANQKSFRDARRAPMFEDEDPTGDAPFVSNAHCETQYEDMRRLPTQSVFQRTAEGYEMVDQQPPLSARVRGQVLDSIAARTGSMTFASQLDRSKGVGTLGDTGGVQARGSGMAGEAPRGSRDRYAGEMAYPAVPSPRRRRS